MLAFQKDDDHHFILQMATDPLQDTLPQYEVHIEIGGSQFDEYNVVGKISYDENTVRIALNPNRTAIDQILIHLTDEMTSGIEKAVSLFSDRLRERT